MSLSDIRKRIDVIDEQIIRLLNERADEVHEVGLIKKSEGAAIYVPEREEQVLRGLSEKAIQLKSRLPEKAIRAIYREIMSASLALEKGLTIAYFGPQATNTHQAARGRFGASVEYTASTTIADVFDAVARGKADYGVVPIENSTEGAVNHTLDVFTESDLCICAQILMKIENHLASKFSKSEIQRLYSHPQVFGQCRNWLRQNLPHVELIEVGSTPRAAELASKEPNSGALVGAMAAEYYGLSLIEPSIQDNPNNTTRFLVIGHNSSQPTGDDRTSLMFSLQDKPGALFSAIEPFKALKINMSKIESRPSKRKAWEYFFFVDLDGHATDPQVDNAIKELEKHCTFVKVLGTYPEIEGVKPSPAPLGVRRSFGFGDRTGFATPGHLAGWQGSGFAPVFAQQSVHELAGAQRNPVEVLSVAQHTLADHNFTEFWGADADGLRTPEDVAQFADAGFTRFTLDLSENIVDRAATLTAIEIDEALVLLAEDEIFADGWIEAYSKPDSGLEPITREMASRFSVKYGWAIEQAAKLAAQVSHSCAGRTFEIEVDISSSSTPTDPMEHLFLANELHRRSIPIVAIALRLSGDFEAAVDYEGNIAELEAALTRHISTIEASFPHQISIPRGGDKFSILPALGRICGDHLHIKTAGTSWLEALRVVARTEPGLFRELLPFCQEQFIFDRSGQPISTNEDDVRFIPDVADADLERVFLNERQGRQLLHVTAGSILTGFDTAGHPWRERLFATLEAHADLHTELLAAHFRRHFECLNAG